MATSQGKRSIRCKSTRKQRIAAGRKLLLFPQARGKVLEGVEFSTYSDYHNICLNFEDKTCLNFVIDPVFTLTTDYSDWKTGNQRVLRAWRPVRNA